MPNLKELAYQEREDLAKFLATLEPEQWDAPSLCEGWRVRDVVGHMISYEKLGFGGVMRRFVKARLSFSRANDLGVAEAARLSPRQLLDEFNDCLHPRGLTTAFGGMVALVDGFIHHQDIRRGLGIPRDMPVDRLAEVLRLSPQARPILAKQRARGLRLVATDCDFELGSGPLVEGPGEAMLLALAGRDGIAAELTGPGQTVLAARAADPAAA